jgi:hypothetical protein
MFTPSSAADRIIGVTLFAAVATVGWIKTDINILSITIHNRCTMRTRRKRANRRIVRIISTNT